MNKLFGYGEDAFTLWALKKRISEILHKLNDQSNPSDCLKFFRPSFGRSGGSGSAQFGEFDSILASSEDIYLIESKWDNFSENLSDEITLDNEQILRHKILSWYFMNWTANHYLDWREFINTVQNDFITKFPDRKIAPAGSLLAQNLEFVLNKLLEHCKRFNYSPRNPKNVLLYFYNKNKSKEIKRVVFHEENFNSEVVNIDYSQYISGNFIDLD